MLSNFPEEPNLEKGVWQFQEAKAKLSEVLNRVDKSGCQAIIRNKKCFFILNEETYKNYIGSHKSILDIFLQCPHPEIELDLTRSKETLRDFEL